MADMESIDTEPFEGYTSALANVRENGVTPSTLGAEGSASLPGGMSQEMLLQALMAPAPTQGARGTQEPAEPPKWMWFIPGFGKGVAMRRQMDAQQEELKLRKQQLAGQQAMQKLQQIQLQQKIAQQQSVKRWGGLYAGLVQHGDILDPQATQEIEGQMVQELAEAGDPDKVQKFIEARRSQKMLSDMEKMQQQMGRPALTPEGAPSATAPSSIPSAASEAPAPAPPAVAEGGLLAQDKLKLARLRQEEATLEQTLQGYARFATTKEGKAMLDSGKDTLTRVREDIKHLEERTSFKNHPIEQVTGIPVAYLTPEQIQQGGEKLQQRLLERARQQQAEGLIAQGQKAYEAAVGKPLEGEARLRMNTMLQAEDYLKALSTEFTPEERTKYVGVMGLRLKGKRFEQMVRELTNNPTDPKLGRFAALLAGARAEAFSTGGKALTETEKNIVFGYIPTGDEWSAADFEQKLAFGLQRLPNLIDREIALATTSAKDLAARRQRGDLPALSPPGATAPPAPKRVTAKEIDTALAERNAARATQGLRPLTRAEYVKALREKGYEVP